jgi:hypothetical protein
MTKPVKQPASRETGPGKLAADIWRAIVGMAVRQSCVRYGAVKRGLYWDGVERAYFCPGCIR